MASGPVFTKHDKVKEEDCDMMNLLRVLIQDENRMEIWIDLIGDTKTYLNVLVFSKCFLEESKLWTHAIIARSRIHTIWPNLVII